MPGFAYHMSPSHLCTSVNNGIKLSTGTAATLQKARVRELEPDTRTKLGRFNLYFLHGTGLVPHDYGRTTSAGEKEWILSQECGEENDLHCVSLIIIRGKGI